MAGLGLGGVHGHWVCEAFFNDQTGKWILKTHSPIILRSLLLGASAVNDFKIAFVHQRPHDSAVEVEEVLGTGVLVVFDHQQK